MSGSSQWQGAGGADKDLSIPRVENRGLCIAAGQQVSQPTARNVQCDASRDLYHGESGLYCTLVSGCQKWAWGSVAKKVMNMSHDPFAGLTVSKWIRSLGIACIDLGRVK